MVTAESIRAALQCGEPGCACGRPGGHVHCPGHEDKTPSLSVTNGGDKILVKCFGGCEQNRVIDALKARNLWPSWNGNRAKKFHILKEYGYVDAAGKLIYQNCRIGPIEPKEFRQRRPDGNGGWIWKMTGVKLLPYALPDLLAANSVFICEGEKDCDNLAALGLPATTNVAGAGQWRKEYNRHFKSKSVVILPDNDKPGRAHAQQVAQHLHGVADVVRVLELPGLPEKGDVSDWLQAGGTVEELKELANAAPDWEPPEQAQEPTGETAPAPELPPTGEARPPPQSRR